MLEHEVDTIVTTQFELVVEPCKLMVVVNHLMKMPYLVWV